MTKKDKFKMGTKNFLFSEFECPCCGKNMVTGTLISKLQELRDIINEPIFITSGYRCKAYNKKISGYANSPHCKGLAADIYCENIDIYELAGRADLIFSRIGLYPDNHFIHVDILPAKPSKFWLVKKYGAKPIYSKREKNLAKFLKNNL